MIRTSSPIVDIGVRTVTPLGIVVAAYLFFAGHNQPGGGFAAGLVIGAVLSLRTVAGLYTPRHGITMLAWGALVAAGTAVAPLFAGDVLLDQVIWSVELPVLGKLKTGTSALFDLGVVLIVVGLVDAVLDGMGTDDLAISNTAIHEPIVGPASASSEVTP